MNAAARRGQVFLEQGRFKEAEKYFRDALAEDPNDAPSLYFLSVCLARQDREKEALAAIESAIAIFPEAADFHAFRALLLSDLRRPADAQKSAEEATRLDPDSDYAWCSQAAVFLNRKEWGKAESAARKALELNPENTSAAGQLATALRLQNRLGESAEQTAYMLERNPESPSARIAAGWTDLQRGDHRKAEEHFLEALRADADNAAAREGLKEAFRARSPFYRLYLQYCFTLQRLTEKNQWLIILGLLFAVKVARAVLPGPLAMLVVVLYFLFVLWVHVARAVGNFQLLFDRFARHALNRAEKWEAWVVGGGITLGLPLFLAGLGFANEAAIIGGLTLIGAAFPLVYTFTNRSVAGRFVFGAAAGLVLLAGALNLGAVFSLWADFPEIGALTGAASLAVVLVTWLANVRFLRG